MKEQIDETFIEEKLKAVENARKELRQMEIVLEIRPRVPAQVVFRLWRMETRSRVMNRQIATRETAHTALNVWRDALAQMEPMFMLDLRVEAASNRARAVAFLNTALSRLIQLRKMETVSLEMGGKLLMVQAWRALRSAFYEQMLAQQFEALQLHDCMTEMRQSVQNLKQANSKALKIRNKHLMQSFFQRWRSAAKRTKIALLMATQNGAQQRSAAAFRVWRQAEQNVAEMSEQAEISSVALEAARALSSLHYWRRNVRHVQQMKLKATKTHNSRIRRRVLRLWRMQTQPRVAVTPLLTPKLLQRLSPRRTRVTNRSGDSTPTRTVPITPIRLVVDHNLETPKPSPRRP